MLGHHLIERTMDTFTDNGAVLSVSKDSESLVINGMLLQPCRIKNDIVTTATLEWAKWGEPVELYDSYDEKNEKPGNLLGAGKIYKDKDKLFYAIKLLNPKYCENVNFVVSKMGLNAFERIYPIVPIIKVKDSEAFCTICNENLQTCKHEVGKDYVRTVCRRRIFKMEVSCLVWSGIRAFTVEAGTQK